MQTVAALLKTMSHPHRLRILLALEDGEKCVREISDRISLSQPLTSQHLAKLREAGLVVPRRQAHEVFYAVTSEQVLTVVRTAQFAFKPAPPVPLA